jgi:hypothetical protein
MGQLVASTRQALKIPAHARFGFVFRDLIMTLGASMRMAQIRSQVSESVDP